MKPLSPHHHDRDDDALPELQRTITSADENGQAIGPTPPAADVEGARYVVESEVARGGLGRILKAHDRRLERPVAVKELLGSSASLRERFQREAAITARLQHPAIVPVYDAGTWSGGDPYYVMKLLGGGATLRDAIAAAPALAQRLALLPHVIAVADAIAYAHSLDIIHRDLKPSNVLIGPFGETLVIDWGLAKDLQSRAPADDEAFAGGPYRSPAPELTHAGSVMGTPQYMAPEQARGQRVDKRADVYALGALLYHVLAGAPARGEVATDGALEQARAGRVAPLRQRQPDVPGDLQAIVAKAMAVDVAARYADAQELVDDLKRFQTGQLVRAHEYSPGMLLRRWLRAHRVVLSLAALFVLLLATTLAVSFRRVTRARTEAVTQRNQLILSQARSALDRSPTQALAWLKSYPSDGAHWDEAQLIAADAVSRGVARHVLPTGQLLAAAFTPDGRRLVTAGDSGHIDLWDAASGRKLRSLPSPDRNLQHVDISSDGQLAAIVGLRGDLVLWNLATGASRVLGSVPGGLFVVSFAPDGRTLAAGGVGVVARYDLASGAVTLEEQRGDSLFALAFSPDGRWLGSSSSDGLIELERLSDHSRRRWQVHGGQCVGLGFSADSRLMAVGDGVGMVRVWQTDSGAMRELGRHPDGSIALRFLGRSHDFVTAGEKHTVGLWSAERGLVRELRGAGGELQTLAVSPDGLLVAASDNSGDVTVWQAGNGASQQLRGQKLAVALLAFNADSSMLVAGGAATETWLWRLDAPRPRLVQAYDGGDLGLGYYSPDGRWYAWESGTTIYVCGVADDQCRRFTGHRATIFGLAFAPDSRHLLSASFDGSARWWSLDDGSAKVLAAPGTQVRDVRVAPDGSRIAVASSDGIIRVWRDPGEPPQLLRGHTDAVRSLDFAAHGHLLASGGQDGAVWLWDLDRGTQKQLLAGGPRVGTVGFSPSGTRLVANSANLTTHIWDLQHGDAQQVWAPATDQRRDELVATSVFSPDGRLLYAAASDGALRSWELASGRQQWERQTHDGRGHVARLSPDGKLLVTAHDDAIHLWNRETGAVALLRGHEATTSWAAFSPDGQTLLSNGEDLRLLHWRLSDAVMAPAGATALRAWLAQTSSVEPALLRN